MSDFTTPESTETGAATDTVAPPAVVPPVAPAIEAKPKAKRKRKKAAKKRAPRTKKQPASIQANETPLTDPVSHSVQPLSEIGAAGHPPAAPLHFTTRARDGFLSLRAHGIGPVEQIVAAAAIVVLMATGAYACSFFG